jgi:hypothetical protein
MNVGLWQAGARCESQQIRSYAELEFQLRRDLRAQHPEWIDSAGNSLMCEVSDRRLAKLISFFQSADQKLRKS